MIRSLEAGDEHVAALLLEAAFAPSLYEARLRELVAQSGEPSHEWVASRDGRVVGYLLYTPATIEGQTVGWHLAPVAVAPSHQGQGIGSELIRHTLEAEPISSSAVFVLGDPGYYERFGFEPSPNTRCAYDPGGQHFRALRWKEPEAPVDIGYAPAFGQAT